MTRWNPDDAARLAAELREDDAMATSAPWRRGDFEHHHVFCDVGNPELMAPMLGRVLLRMNQHYPYAEDAAAIARLRNNARAAAEQLEAARVRIDELLALVARISQETPLPSEVEGALDSQRALIAEVGTLRARCAELERALTAVLGSATPNPRDHPTMVAALREADRVLHGVTVEPLPPPAACAVEIEGA